jgi:K+-transporting ATPase ATPase C chain
MENPKSGRISNFDFRLPLSAFRFSIFDFLLKETGMWKQLGSAFRLIILFTVLTGLVYPGLVTALCQALFHDRANGSLVEVDGRVVGSSLIGQNFTRPEYFHPRPSAAGDNGYDASASNASNFGPTNQKLIDRVKASIEQFRKENPDYSGPVPADLVTASGSGLDPDISIASAEAQAARIAKARRIGVEQVLDIINRHAKGRRLGFLGEPRVNVLTLNLELDRSAPLKP